MDRWKAEMGRVREKRRVEEGRSEKRKSQEKEDADARKARKAKHCVFPMICGSGGSKSRLIWPDERWKIARRCGAKHMSKSKCTKHTCFGPFLEVVMSKKCTPVWREANFEVKSAKNWRVRSTFGRSDVLSRGRRKGLSTFSKVSKTWGFCGISKNDGRRGTFEEDLQRCISRGRRSAKGADFLRGVAFWSIRSAGLLRWFCVTGAAPRMTWHQFFLAGTVL